MGDRDHHQHHQAHADADRQHLHCMFQLDQACRQYRADGDAHGEPCDQLGCFTDAVVQGDPRPGQHQQAQGRSRAPEQRGDRERDLAQRVFPQQRKAMPEVLEQEQRAAAERFVFDGDERDVKVDQCRNEIDEEDDEDGHLGRCHGGRAHADLA